MQRFLDPEVLAGISSLDLLAKTVVDGFVAGLHRSPDFGFSQEFAEYRAYTPGDDLRHVDWNLFARTERCYLKRYRGETNSQLTVLLDASNSMQYTSGPPSKMDYARYIAASLFYLAIRDQRDAAVALVLGAGDQRVNGRGKAETRRVGRHVMDAAVSDHDDAGDAIRRHVGERRGQRREQPRAVGFAVGLAGLDDADIEAWDALEPVNDGRARRFGLRHAVAEVLARALVDDDDGDRTQRIAVLAREGGIGERQHDQRQSRSSHDRAAAARDKKQ